MAFSKARAHTRYKLSTGKQVPGVTTVLNVLNKPALIVWANKMGLQGIDSTKYRDEAADVGTLAHYLIMCDLTGTTPDATDYSPNQLALADNSLSSYYVWKDNHDIVPFLVETPLVSECLEYGGTVDLYAKVDGIPTLVDFKTGKALYSEMFYQVAAYKRLLEENKMPVEKTRVLRIGRDDGEGFEERMLGDLEDEYLVFLHCLAIYNLQKNKK